MRSLQVDLDLPPLARITGAVAAILQVQFPKCLLLLDQAALPLTVRGLLALAGGLGLLLGLAGVIFRGPLLEFQFLF